MISVIIPLYNKEKYIANTLDSVLLQEDNNFEVVVVNDGSIDNGPKIVVSYNDPRIRLITQKNAGVSAARNRGVMEAKYPYVAFLDADDYWTPNHIGTLHELIRQYGAEADIFATNFVRLFPDGEQQVNREDLNEGVIINYFKVSRKNVVLNSSCVCVSKRAFNFVGGFDERFSMGEDIHLWNRLARKYKVAYSSVVTSVYVIGAENNSAMSVDYSRDAARVALQSTSSNFYDFITSSLMYLKYVIKKIIHYKPRVRKRK